MSLFFLIFFKISFAAEMKLTADDIPKLVQEKNRNVSGASLMKDAAQSKTGHLFRSYLPSVKAFGGRESFQTGVYTEQTQPYGGIEANINLFRGGRDSLEEQIRLSQSRSATANAQGVFNSELKSARKLYWEIVSSRELLKILSGALGQNEKTLALANRRIHRGLGTETDRLDFQIHKGQLDEEIESITHELVLLQMSLAAILGVDEGTSFKTPELVEHVHDEVLLAKKISSESNPEFIFFKSNEESLRNQYKQSSRWWLPSVDLYGGYQLFTTRDRDYLTEKDRIDKYVGARLIIEFDFMKVSDSFALALEAQGAQKQAEQKSISLETEIKVTQEELKHEHELIHFSEERAEQGKRYLNRTMDEYNRGVKNSIDALGALQKYLSFQRESVERRKNYQIKKAEVLFLTNS